MKIILLFFCVGFITADGDLEKLMASSRETQNLIDSNDSSAIDQAVERLNTLVGRASRLKNRLMTELETTVNFLKMQLKRRELSQSKDHNENASNEEERKLIQQNINPKQEQINSDRSFMKMERPI